MESHHGGDLVVFMLQVEGKSDNKKSHDTTAQPRERLKTIKVVNKERVNKRQTNKHTTTKKHKSYVQPTTADQVLSYFPEGWRETAAFESTVDTEHDTMREIRCCLNSEQCDLGKDRQEAIDCSVYITETSNERALLGAELFVVRRASSRLDCGVWW